MVDPAETKLTRTTENSMQFVPPRPILIKPDIHPDDLDPSDDEEGHASFLERSFKAMSLQTGLSHLGKASRFFFFKKAFKYKYENAGVEPPDLQERKPWSWKKDPSELLTHHPVSRSHSEIRYGIVLICLHESSGSYLFYKSMNLLNIRFRMVT
jgi:hypothetical protein